MSRVYQNSDGTYEGAHGTSYDSEGAAEASKRQAAASQAAAAETSKILGNFLNMVGPALIIIPILGAMACIFMAMIAGMRGFLILAKTFWLFGLFAIPALFIMFIKSKRINLKSA